MPRVALRLAYDGALFDSYARQPDRRTVEGALIEALGPEGLVEGSFRTGSRTDAGVSALENVCAATLHRPHLRGLVPSVQRRLPEGLWLTAAAGVPDGFDPRRAGWRQYRYLAAAQGEAEWPMRDAAAAFVGRHRMHAFARVEADRDPERTVLDFVVGTREGMWVFHVRGESFLWNQVRRMVGAVLAVGRGEAAPGDVTAALASGLPHGRFTVAPAEGLLLERVHHDGLAWGPAAGTVMARHAWPALAAALVRLDVAHHVAHLAGQVPPEPASVAGPTDAVP